MPDPGRRFQMQRVDQAGLDRGPLPPATRHAGERGRERRLPAPRHAEHERECRCPHRRMLSVRTTRRSRFRRAVWDPWPTLVLVPPPGAAGPLRDRRQPPQAGEPPRLSGSDRTAATARRPLRRAPTATVLDIGCGNGLWTSVAAYRTGAGCVVGLDRSPGMLEVVAPACGADRGRARRRSSASRCGSGSVDVVLAERGCSITCPTKRPCAPRSVGLASRRAPDRRGRYSGEVLPTLDELFRSCWNGCSRPAGAPLDRAARLHTGERCRRARRLVRPGRSDRERAGVRDPGGRADHHLCGEPARTDQLRKWGSDFDFAAFLDVLRPAL